MSIDVGVAVPDHFPAEWVDERTGDDGGDDEWGELILTGRGGWLRRRAELVRIPFVIPGGLPKRAGAFRVVQVDHTFTHTVRGVTGARVVCAWGEGYCRSDYPDVWPPEFRAGDSLKYTLRLNMVMK